MKKEEIQKLIYEYLKRFEINQNSKGFKYIMRAIEIRIKEHNNTDIGICQLYKSIANEYGDTASRVERSIRHCITTGNRKLKNSEFIETAANEVAFGYKNNELSLSAADEVSMIIRLNEVLEEVANAEAEINRIKKFLGV